MKLSKLSLPHPVLGISDDVTGEYSVVEPNIELGVEEIDFKFKHKLSNKTLESMIASSEAAYSVEVNCDKTFYRETFNTQDTSQEIKIKSNLLRDRVDCTFYVTAAVDISKYTNSEANPDYEGFDFFVSKGDVLAFGGTTFFMAEKQWQAYRSVSSFMHIRKDENREQGPMEIDLNQEKIIITLSKVDYDRYNAIYKAEHLSSIFHCAIVLPALIYAVSQMITDRGEAFSGLKWHEMLLFRKNNDNNLKDIDWQDSTYAPKIAQILLDDPLNRTLSDIESIVSQPEE